MSHIINSYLLSTMSLTQLSFFSILKFVTNKEKVNRNECFDFWLRFGKTGQTR